MSLAIFFHLLCAQHVSDINIAIFIRQPLFVCCVETTQFNKILKIFTVALRIS